MAESTKENRQQSPTSSSPQHLMTPEEREVADGIFHEYSKFRRARDAGEVKRSEDCDNMAYQCLLGCAAIRGLKHRLGIPVSVASHYSDVLLYSTWKMDPKECLSKWVESSGHRKMLQCDSSEVAGCASYYDNKGNIWYYAIVYDFRRRNQSGF